MTTPSPVPGPTPIASDSERGLSMKRRAFFSKKKKKSHASRVRHGRGVGALRGHLPPGAVAETDPKRLVTLLSIVWQIASIWMSSSLPSKGSSISSAIISTPTMK